MSSKIIIFIWLIYRNGFHEESQILYYDSTQSNRAGNISFKIKYTNSYIVNITPLSPKNITSNFNQIGVSSLGLSLWTNLEGFSYRIWGRQDSDYNRGINWQSKGY